MFNLKVLSAASFLIASLFAPNPFMQPTVAQGIEGQMVAQQVTQQIHPSYSPIAVNLDSSTTTQPTTPVTPPPTTVKPLSVKDQNPTITPRKFHKKHTSEESASKLSMAGKEEMDMRATAYGVAGNDQWGMLTAMGTKCRPGVIAVDPNVIPLGTKVYVTGYDSPYLPKGGFVATAEDTGGAIKGDRIDIFMTQPENEISDFGIQNVKIYILKK